MSDIPNELKIIINTSIPGFQSIRYKPSMTLPDDKTDGTVQFNPLVKLKSSVIKSLPENIQKKEFLNKGLFQSLINSHGLSKSKSLGQATKEGIVDNNIKVTLDTLFPTNSVIYINKQPYVIADVQWTNGDWKIDKKIQQVPQLESSRLTDPYLYNTVVKDEIIRGEEQLKQLPKDVIYGSNYTGPPNVASGVKTTFQPSTVMGPPMVPPIKPPKPYGVRPVSPLKPAKPAKTIKPVANVKPVKPVKPIQPSSLSSRTSLAYEAKERDIQNQFLKLMRQQQNLLQQQKFVSQQLLNQENKLSNDKRRLFLEQQEQIRKEREKLNLQQQLLTQELNMLRFKFQKEMLNMFRNNPALPPSSPSNPFGNPFDNPALPPSNPYGNPFDDIEIVENEEIPKPLQKIVLETSVVSTQKLKTYFGDKNYYFMLNILFQNMEAPEKDKINEVFKQSTGVDAKAVKGLSKPAYDNTVKNMKVIRNAGGGDCFFIAVADAINYYNANTPVVANKIVYNNYGLSTPFTQLVLRQIVFVFISVKNRTPFNQLIIILQNNAEEMNDMFQVAYENFIQNVGPVTPENFKVLVDNIYFNDEKDNFLVKKPTEMTEETLKKPFSMITSSELESYINSSDYWGNPIAINALCEMLGLNVIVIENKNENMRIPYIYDGNKPWNKYLFIYNTVGHYELITFDFVFNNKQAPVTKTIFKNNFLNPPFYIIFLIFATSYFRILTPEDKQNYKMLPVLMEKIFDIYKKIEANSTSKTKQIKKDSDKFLALFNDYFLRPPRQIIPKEEVLDFGDIYGKGGALSPYQYNNRPNTRPYQNQSQYQYQYQPQYQYQYQPRSTRMPYVSSFIKNTPTTQIVTPQTDISYYITIDMFLKKGTELSDKDKSNLKCNHRWNSIRKNYADLRGIKYVPTPDYNMLPSSFTKTTPKSNSSSSSSKTNKSKTQKMGLDLKRKNNSTTRRSYLSS